MTVPNFVPNDFGPPPPINQDSITIVRKVLASGQVVTTYVDKLTGAEVGLQPTYHLSKPAASFIPPPTVVAVEEAEQILAEEVSD